MRHVPGLALAAIAAIALLACGETEEATQSDSPGATTPPASGSATPTESPGGSATAEPSPSPAASPSPTSSPAPSEWQTYEAANGLFSVRYPPGWFADDGSITSFSLTDWDQPGLPPEIIEVEVGSYADDGVSGCGIISIDKDGNETTPPEATMTELGGQPAWRIVRSGPDPLLEGGLTRIDGFSAIYGGYCFTLVGYFTQSDPDTSTFDELVESYEFGF